MAKTAKSYVGPEIVAPSEKELDQFLAPLKRDVEDSLEELKTLSVETPAEMAVAGELLKELAHRQTVLDEKRKSWVEPLKSVANDIDATFRPVIKGLAAGVELLKAKIGACEIALKNKRAELLLASTSAIGKKAEALLAEAANFIAPEIQGVSTKITWTGGVTDASLLPREYLVPNVKQLEELTAALGRDPKIPGWGAWETSSTTTTRKGR